MFNVFRAVLPTPIRSGGHAGFRTGSLDRGSSSAVSISGDRSQRRRVTMTTWVVLDRRRPSRLTPEQSTPIMNRTEATKLLSD